MNRGCIIFAFVLVVGIGIAGFFAYRALRASLELPADLAAFNHGDSLRSHLVSSEPAPSDSTALTAVDMRLFLDALPPINSGWKPLEAKFDSLGLNAEGKKGNDISILATPQILSEMILIGPRTRKALAEYLNSRKLSLDRYIWLKEHVVAASGITKDEADSAFGSRLALFLGDGTSNTRRGGDKNFDAFFARVESIRAAGLVDSTEAALVLPYRATILGEGLPCLMGIETNTSFNVDMN